MYSFKTTERHLALLKIPFGVRTSNGAARRGYTASKYLNSNKDPSERKFLGYGRSSTRGQIKVRKVDQQRQFTTATTTSSSSTTIANLEIPLLNPLKPGPELAKNIPIKPLIAPLTAPRFAKNVVAMPSVTKILSATMPAASQFILDRWKEAMLKKLGAAGFAKYQQETFERGRVLHSLIASYLLGEGAPQEITMEVVANLWASIENVVKENISNVRLVEHVVTHGDMKYRGIVDCVAFYKDELVVIDFKTAEKPKKTIESLYDNPLQVTAYCGAINNDKNIPEHVIDRNICAGLVIVAYIDGSPASVYYLGREQILNNYWKQWTVRLDQYTRLEAMKKEESKETVAKI